MCGRFAITLPPDAMAQLFEARPDNDLPAVPNYNVCPTDPIHVIRSEDGVRRLVAMRWGLIRPGTRHRTTARRCSTRAPRRSPRSPPSGTPRVHAAA